MDGDLTGAPHGAIFGVLKSKTDDDPTVRGVSQRFKSCSTNQHYTIRTRPLDGQQLAWSLGCDETPTASPGMVCRAMPENTQHGLNIHAQHAWWPTRCANGAAVSTLVDSGWPGLILDRAYKNQINVAGSGTFADHPMVAQFDAEGGGTICLSDEMARQLDQQAEQSMCSGPTDDNWW